MILLKDIIQLLIIINLFNHLKEYKKKILADIFKIIAAYDHSNQFQRIEIESYILHLLYTLLSNTLDKKQI